MLGFQAGNNIAQVNGDVKLNLMRDEKLSEYRSQIVQLEAIQALYIKNISNLKTMVEAAECQLKILHETNEAQKKGNEDQLRVLTKELSDVNEKIKQLSSQLSALKKIIDPMRNMGLI